MNFVLPAGRRACSAPRAAVSVSSDNDNDEGPMIKIPTLLPVGLGAEVSFVVPGLEVEEW